MPLHMSVFIVYCVLSSTFLDTAVIVIESIRFLTMVKQIVESSRYLWDGMFHDSPVHTLKQRFDVKEVVPKCPQLAERAT